MRRGTYSIVARDAASGAVGVAVQSHWFSVGSLVSWVEAGVGAVATQSVAEPAYGPRLLARLAGGEAPGGALGALLADDDAAQMRQVAVVDAGGAVAVHTGPGCIAAAGHVTGAGFACQGNMMARAGVPEAMAASFEAAPGSLAERLLAALEAGEGAGGDVRGRQSAVLLVAPGAGERWHREVDLRVEDDPAPLGELRRLLTLHRAYALAEEADALAALGRHADAAACYEGARELAPHSDELLFWAGIGAAQAGDLATGVERVRAAIATNPAWSELLPRIGPEIAPGAAAVRAAMAG